MPSQHKGESPSRSTRSESQSDPANDRGGGQGRVRDPAHDGRLKANKARGISKGTTHKDESVAPGGQGRVKDPSRDRRLKKNQQQ
jgi:hypothetical protein